MSWAPDSPVELPDGRLVCGNHGLVVCGSCCVDYSFMDDVLDDDAIEGRVRRPEEYEDDLDRAGALDIEKLDPIRHMEISRGSESVLPRVFVPPPSATPQSLFPAGIGRKAHPTVTRFIRADDPESLLIYTDGACLGNGQVEPKGGWAFVFWTARTKHHCEYKRTSGKTRVHWAIMPTQPATEQSLKLSSAPFVTGTGQAKDSPLLSWRLIQNMSSKVQQSGSEHG